MANFFNVIYDVLGVVFGPVMRFFFNLVGNYGLAIIVFTIFCRLLQLPFSVSQHKNQAKNHRAQMKLRKIQEKYKDDKQRQQQETQAFYQREGYNPMKAGCSGGMILQMPIMFGLIAAINRPLRYALQIPREIINVLTEAAEALANNGGGLGGTAMMGGGPLQVELRIAENIEYFAYMFDYGEALYGYGHYLARIEEFARGFTLFGFQLGLTPNEAGFGVYYWIPALTAITAMLTAGFTFWRQRKTGQQPPGQNALMMGCTTFGMPLFTAWIALSFPVGVGFFWIMSSLVAFVQVVALTYLLPPQKMLARVLVDETVVRRSRENSKKKITDLH